MRTTVHSRPLCILMIISMLVLGIYCEDIHDDSSFSRVFDQYRAVSLQSADHLADTHAYYEKGAFRLIEEYVLTRQSARTPAGVRIQQNMLAALLMICAYLLSLSFRNVNLCIDGYPNQYNRRTLEYIHRDDGKKSHTM